MTDRDWEKDAARRLQRVVDSLVRQVRDTADQIEREGKRDIEAAASGATQYATYGRVAGQALHELHMLVANVSASTIIDAAYDADSARLEKQ